ncbi:MAG TPA: AtpZ/AtpI family protein [Candidatus Acidoferrales bacterium]|nr:AtpZ/AtpI family protein [Candidatus Acidoferrales bacterium]
MKSVLTAGSTFAVTVLGGLLLGVAIGERTRQPLWALAGLFVGLGIGGYSAVRLLMRSL